MWPTLFRRIFSLLSIWITRPSCTTRLTVPKRIELSSSRTSRSNSRFHWSGIGAAISYSLEQRRGKVTLGAVGQDHHDGLAGELVQLGQTNRSSSRRAAGDPHQEPLLFGKAFGEFDGLV